MRMREVTNIVLTLADGTTEEIDVPEGAAFMREGYTFFTSNGKVTHTLWTNEVFWTYTTEGNTVAHGPPRPSKIIERTPEVEKADDLGTARNGENGSGKFVPKFSLGGD
jgi:prolyl oligopeptidase PreP (S9A serine peptidase family)